ncbi:MAG: GspH/FimT family pseudopilin [Halopseudomonas sabulinigri]
MRSVKGFTLIELMVTIAVLAVIISLAVPSFSSIIRDNRLFSLSQELRGTLQQARSEAVKRNEVVTVCRSNVGSTDCANGTAWEAGWLIKVGSGTGEILASFQAAQGVSITGPTSGLTFRRNGMASTGNASWSVTSSGCTGTQKRVVRVNKVGNVTLDKESC